MMKMDFPLSTIYKNKVNFAVFHKLFIEKLAYDITNNYSDCKQKRMGIIKGSWQHYGRKDLFYVAFFANISFLYGHINNKSLNFMQFKLNNDLFEAKISFNNCY